MLNANSLPEQVHREYHEDVVKAEYWFKKAHHGEKAYYKWKIQMAQQLGRDLYRREIYSDPVEYLSKNGNHWLSYEHISKDGEGGCFTIPYSIMYYETVASVGAYVEVGYDDDGKRRTGYIHFTPHFFLRFAERLEIPNTRKELMLRFMRIVHVYLMLEKPPRPGYKDAEFALRYPDSYAFGSYRDFKDFRLVTVRTFYTEASLPPSKKKWLSEYAKLHDMSIQDIQIDMFNRNSKRIEI